MLRTTSTFVLVFVVALAAVVLATSSARAGLISGPVTFTDDISSGVSNSKTYTHLIDGGFDDPAAVVNGVTFSKVNLGFPGPSSYTSTALGFQIEVASDVLAGYEGNEVNIGVADTQGMYGLLKDFFYDGYNGGSEWCKMTLTSPESGTPLMVGATYEARLYYRPWTLGGDRYVTITFDEDGAGSLGASTMINEDGATSPSASYISYKYVYTGSPLTITLAPNDEAKVWHMYGLSNELVPEPGTLALLAAGLIGLLAYAWRKRR